MLFTTPIPMNYPKYIFTSSTDSMTFEFISNGTKGKIDKMIRYECIDEDKKIYNLCFGNKIVINEQTGELKIDDLAISNNGDLEKILATVAASAYVFAQSYPDRLIFFRGSTKSRTRLYRRAIFTAYDEISEKFDIFGAIIDGTIVKNVPFEPNGDFLGFFIKPKVKTDESD